MLSEDLAERLREDWAARAKAIERALAEPDALELSADAHRAEAPRRRADERPMLIERQCSSRIGGEREGRSNAGAPNVCRGNALEHVLRK